ncbi:SBBP repeat-containing protein, partial [Clostridium disporicum]
LLYGTYFGGNDSTNFSALAIDQNNYVYITGITQSSDFPVTENSYKTKVTGGLSSAFITKFDLEKDGEEGVLYSSLLCGNGEEAGYGIAVDLEENVYITGTTNSREDFPISENAFQKNIYAIEGSGFFIKLDTKLCGDNGLIYGTYLGGNGSDVCSDIKIDSNGYAYICGFTTSTDFPVEGYDNGWVKDGYNSFFIKIDPSKEKRKSLLVGKFLRKNISDFALAMAIDNNLNLYITGYSHSISKSMEKREGNYYEEAAIGMIKIDARICNLSVTKSSYNNQAKIGEITEYEISIINNGPDKAKDIEIIDVIGDGKAIKEIEISKGEISNIAKKIIWNIRELNIGERAWATIRVRVLDNSESIKDNNFINLKDNIYYSKEYIKEYMDECILNK